MNNSKHFSPFRDHPSDFLLTTSRALRITDEQLISLVLDDPQEPELLEDEFDYIVLIIVTLTTSSEDRTTLAAELRDLMT